MSSYSDAFRNSDTMDVYLALPMLNAYRVLSHELGMPLCHPNVYRVMDEHIRDSVNTRISAFRDALRHGIDNLPTTHIQSFLNKCRCLTPVIRAMPSYCPNSPSSHSDQIHGSG